VSLILGAAALFLFLWLARSYVKASPALMARYGKQAGGVAAIGVAVLLAVRGRIDIAMPLGFFGAALLGLQGFGVPGWAQRTTTTPGAQSRVRSATIEMVMDHDTGGLSGRVLAGPLEGSTLDDLDEAALASLATLCRQADPDGLRLLEAYLDRRFPGRRETAQEDAHPGPSPRAPAGAMTEQEAYEVLGLPAGAGEDEVRRAHRALMKKLHPDQGGSTYLATRVNQAKDVLLNRHR